MTATEGDKVPGPKQLPGELLIPLRVKTSSGYARALCMEFVALGTFVA